MSEFPTPAELKKATQKESAVGKIFGGLSWWFNSLTGKPQARKIPQQVSQAPQAAPAPTDFSKQAPVSATKMQSTEDPVSQDLESIKKLVGKLSGKMQQTAAPAVSKGVSSATQAAGSFVKTADKGFLQKIVRIVVIVVALAVLAFIGMRLFTTYKEETPGGVVTPSGSVSPTPTPLVFVPKEPSVYANDPIILQLEEDINVLVREIGGQNIRETQLNPPALDFNVKF